jgi:hypothetical protein
LDAPIYAKQLENLVKKAKSGRFVFDQFGDGLIIGVYRHQGRSMYSHLNWRNSKHWSRRLGPLDSHAPRIMKKESDQNSVFIGSLFYSGRDGPHFVFGSIPLFWWPIKAEVIRSIVFQDVLVFSIYNPAHLFERLKAEGFEIIMESPQKIQLRKNVDGSSVTFENFSYFMHLIQHNFLPEDMVLEIIKASERELIKVKQSGGKSARIELAFEQRLRH